jgi:hypothetical protein
MNARAFFGCTLIAIVKSGARKRAKLAEDMRRSECRGEAHNTSVLTHATSRIEATKAAKEKELLMREKEAAEMDIMMAVSGGRTDAVRGHANSLFSFYLLFFPLQSTFELCPRKRGQLQGE